MNEEIRDCCYRLLEVEPGAPLDVVKAAYLELVKVWHADRLPNDPKFQNRATEKTKALNEAYRKIASYFPGTYTESRASARTAYEQGGTAREAGEAKEREDAARRAREATEAKEREEAIKRAREASAEFNAREEARLREAERQRQWKAAVGCFFGILGIPVSFCPFIGLAIPILGVVFCTKGLKSKHHWLAVAGQTLSIIGVVLSVVSCWVFVFWKCAVWLRA